MRFQDAFRDAWQRRTGVAVLLLLSLFFPLFLARLVHVNTVLRPRLLVQIERQYGAETSIPARRGLIFDRRGRVLAGTSLKPDVFVDPTVAEDLDLLASQLGARLNQPPEAILAELRRRPDSRYVLLATGVDDVTADAVRTLKSPAVGLTERPVRTYSMGAITAHVVGFVGRDGRGLEGIERKFDEHLGGREGRRRTLRNAHRQAIWRQEEGWIQPRDGGHVVLTLDAEIQRIVEEVLSSAVEEFRAESAVSLVMEPSTGVVLAMVSIPGHDPLDLSDENAGSRRNRAITDPVEPGSTFKCFIASAAVEGGFIRPEERINCELGTYTVGRRTIRDVHPYDWLDLVGIITKSSNIGMTKISEKMGAAAMYEAVRRFGFGTPTGIELPGEHPGRVYPLRDWTKESPASISFGYEILVTPLQLASAFCALINGGEEMQPRIVRSLLGPDGTVVRAWRQPELKRRVASPSTARYVSEHLLVGVVEEGTGHAAQVEGYRVLGKTGTSRLTYPDRRGYEPGAYLSAFMGAAPAEAPAVSVLVMIRRPDQDKGYYGGTVAAPVVGEILRQVLAYLEVPPSTNSVALARHGR